MVNTGRKTIVNLLEKTCGCGGFQEYQSPCAYAIVAARYYGDDPYIYFGWWHTLDIYCVTYRRVLLLTSLMILKMMSQFGHQLSDANEGDQKLAGLGEEILLVMLGSVEVVVK
jgi:hypothetical protein